MSQDSWNKQRKTTEAYVCKVTSGGRITLPKKIRDKLNLTKNDHIIIEKIGKTHLIKKY